MASKQERKLLLDTVYNQLLGLQENELKEYAEYLEKKAKPKVKKNFISIDDIHLSDDEVSIAPQRPVKEQKQEPVKEQKKEILYEKKSIKKASETNIKSKEEEVNKPKFTTLNLNAASALQKKSKAENLQGWYKTPLTSSERKDIENMLNRAKTNRTSLDQPLNISRSDLQTLVTHRLPLYLLDKNGEPYDLTDIQYDGLEFLAAGEGLWDNTTYESISGRILNHDTGCGKTLTNIVYTIYAAYVGKYFNRKLQPTLILCPEGTLMQQTFIRELKTRTTLSEQDYYYFTKSKEIDTESVETLQSKIFILTTYKLLTKQLAQIKNHFKDDKDVKSKLNEFNSLVQESKKKKGGGGRKADGLEDIFIKAYDASHKENADEVYLKKVKNIIDWFKKHVLAHSPLLRINFYRIIVDESQNLFSPTSILSKAVRLITLFGANKRIAATATSWNKKVTEFVHLCKYLFGVSEHECPDAWWSHYINWKKLNEAEQKGKGLTEMQKGLNRFRKFIQSRSRQENLEMLKNIVDINITLTEDELKNYDALRISTQGAFQSSIDQGKKQHIRELTLCNLLRRHTIHAVAGEQFARATTMMYSKLASEKENLLKEHVTGICVKGRGIISEGGKKHYYHKKSEPEDVEDDEEEEIEKKEPCSTESITYLCGHVICLKCAKKEKEEMEDVEDEKEDDNIFETVKYTFCDFCDSRGLKNLESSKIKAIVGKVKEIIEGHYSPIKEREKVLIFSEFSIVLDIIEHALNRLIPDVRNSKVKYGRYDGSLPADKKGKLLDSFNEDSRMQILMMTIASGSVGLNLHAANHVILSEPSWKPTNEIQACSRINRGSEQKRKMFFWRFVCPQTLDTAVLEIQKVKVNDRKLLEGKTNEVDIRIVDGKNKSKDEEEEEVISRFSNRAFNSFDDEGSPVTMHIFKDDPDRQKQNKNKRKFEEVKSEEEIPSHSEMSDNDIPSLTEDEDDGNPRITSPYFDKNKSIKKPKVQSPYFQDIDEGSKSIKGQSLRDQLKQIRKSKVAIDFTSENE